jgi:hypothetical protein
MFECNKLMHDADGIRPLSLIHVKAESRDEVNPTS